VFNAARPFVRLISLSAEQHMTTDNEDLPRKDAKTPRPRFPLLLGSALVVMLVAIGVTLVVIEYRSATTDAASPEQESPPVVDFNQVRAQAEQGDPGAQNLLGEIYLNGRGVRPDSRTAAEWFAKSAAQNHAAAQLNLGMLYEAGQGVPVDYSRAAEWYRKAAEQGNPRAQYSLAVVYAYGRGLQRDDQQALKWLTRAAEAGEGLAQFALGHRYLSGTGVPQDLVESFKWFSLAAARNIPNATAALDEIKLRMNRGQITEGRRRTQQFAPRNTSEAASK
jgi:TPR repeat protein